jgi:hypothetical protein
VRRTVGRRGGIYQTGARSSQFWRSAQDRKDEQHPRFRSLWSSAGLVESSGAKVIWANGMDSVGTVSSRVRVMFNPETAAFASPVQRSRPNKSRMPKGRLRAPSSRVSRKRSPNPRGTAGTWGSLLGRRPLERGGSRRRDRTFYRGSSKKRAAGGVPVPPEFVAGLGDTSRRTSTGRKMRRSGRTVPASPDR